MCKMTIRQTSCLVKLLQPCWQVYSLQGGLVVNSVVCHLNPYDSMILWFPQVFLNSASFDFQLRTCLTDVNGTLQRCHRTKVVGSFLLPHGIVFLGASMVGGSWIGPEECQQMLRVERPRIPHHNSYQTTEKERHSKNLQLKKYEIQVLGVGKLNQLLVFIPIYSNIISLSFVWSYLLLESRGRAMARGQRSSGSRIDQLRSGWIWDENLETMSVEWIRG